MALSVVKRPTGYFLDTTVNTATVSSSSGALFTLNAHLLATGDFIYIYSSLAAYNGFWYVSVVSANTFRIREYATASDQAYVNGGTVYYYNSFGPNSHYWNSVHLPIVYKLKSTIWPINGVDTARTITTFTNSNGYTYIQAAGDIKTTGTASSLESVVLLGTSVDGVYKIIQWYSDTNFVINLPYSAANVLSSGTVQYYYLNYHARIRIYAGLAGIHPWAASKPYTLITEQRCVPDSTGIITLNISDFIKDQIEILKNDLQEDELPNDIDSWCNYYISYAESYDDSNMYTVSELVGSYTDDSPVGYAVNAKNQFQNRYSGDLTEYVPNTSPSITLAKFLTPFIRPTLFAGKFWDISYIKPYASGSQMFVKRDLYSKGTDGNYALISSLLDSPTDLGEGVYRYSLSQSASLENRIDLTLLANIAQTNPALSTFINAGSGTNWTTGAAPNITVTGVLEASKNLTGTKSGAAGSYTISVNSTLTVSGGTARLLLLDSNGNTSGTFNIITSSGTNTTNLIVTATRPFTSIAFTFTNAATGSRTFTINSYSIALSQAVSETKVIDVNSTGDCRDVTALYLTWKNYLGGQDYWSFKAQKRYSIDILESKTQEQNIYQRWPNSYGEFADSIEKQTVRRSRNIITVSSQYLTKAQADAIALIVTSPLVQIVTTNTVSTSTIPTLRTVIVDTPTLKKYQDKDMLYSITFNVSYTDEIGVQSL